MVVGEYLPGEPFPRGIVPLEPSGAFEANMHTHLPTDSTARKDQPMATGLLDYFPDALAAVARLSVIGNAKHNPGQPLHWSRGKSDDHADCIMRHMVERGSVDTDGELHDVKVAWRALAQLQLAIEHQRAVEFHGKPQVSWSEPPANSTIVPYHVNFWYLATPYTRFPAGPKAASLMACRLSAVLLRAGVPVFSPIAHSHAIAEAGLQDMQTNHDFWVQADAPLLQAAGGMIVVMAESWEQSRGMAHEIAAYTKAGKPVVYWDPARSLVLPGGAEILLP